MKIVVCIGSACHLKGARYVVEQLQALIARSGLKDRVELEGAMCMGQCQDGVSVGVDGEMFSVTPETVRAFFDENVLPRI